MAVAWSRPIARLCFAISLVWQRAGLPFPDVFNRLSEVMKPLSQRALFRLGVLLVLAAGVGEGKAAAVAPWG